MIERIKLLNAKWHNTFIFVTHVDSIQLNGKSFDEIWNFMENLISKNLEKELGSSGKYIPSFKKPKKKFSKELIHFFFKNSFCCRKS